MKKNNHNTKMNNSLWIKEVNFFSPPALSRGEEKINLKQILISGIIFIILLSSLALAISTPLNTNNIGLLSSHQKAIVENRDISEFTITQTQSGGEYLLTDTINSLIYTPQGHISGNLPQQIPQLNIPTFNSATIPTSVMQPTSTTGSTVPEGWKIVSINGNTYQIKNEVDSFIEANPKSTWDDSRKSFVVPGNWEFNTIQHGALERVARQKTEIAFNAFTAETTTTTETELYDSDDKKPNKKGTQLGKEKTIVTKNTADITTAETNYVFSQKDFSEKGSIEFIYTDGRRSQTHIKDKDGNSVFSISKDGLIARGLEPKEALKLISDPALKEAVRQDMLANPNIHEGRWDIMSTSEKVGTWFKAYNEFKGIASLTSLLSDNYNDYITRRRSYLNSKFCVFMSLGKCFESKICESKIIHSGGGALIGTISGDPMLGAASIRGEKSFSIDTPQGTGFVYKVQYHLENPNNQEMNYNIWFESPSLSKKWFVQDKKLASFQETTSLPNDKEGLKRFSYNNYDKVCIRFDPGIYKFGSTRRISQHCDVFTNDYQEPSQQEIQQVQQATGKDGDV